MYLHKMLAVLAYFLCECLAVDSLGDTQYSIETLVIVDKYAYSSWNHTVHSILTNKDMTNQPRTIITDFIKALFIGVNGVFGTLATSDIKLDVRITGIEFITDESVVTETSAGSGHVNKDTIVDQLDLWLAIKQYPRTDHVMLLTGLKMVNSTADSETKSDPVGIANLGMMCSRKSLSVVENVPNGEIALTLAHELGHSLNASHDGENNTCSNTTMNVMAASGHTNTSSAYRFSKCSIQYFKDMLSALNNDRQGNCLAPARTTAPVVEGVPLGKLFTADQFCQMTGATRIARVCRGGYGKNQAPYSSSCGALYCAIGPDGDECDVVQGADGMTCGNHKECSQGTCVQSPAAPEVSDTCPFGDTPWYAEMAVFSDSNQTRCAQMVADDVTDCYSDVARRSCCASCEAAVPSTGTAGCDYSDMRGYCSSIHLPFECALYADHCCAICRPYYNASNVGCEYGDGAVLCATLHLPYECATRGRTCCDSCKTYHNASRIGCEYGDRSPRCASMHFPQDCYDPDNVYLCCGSCAPFYDPKRTGCEYGDKNPQCKAIIAADRSKCATLKDTCCLSCAETSTSSPSDLIG